MYFLFMVEEVYRPLNPLNAAILDGIIVGIEGFNLGPFNNYFHWLLIF